MIIIGISVVWFVAGLLVAMTWTSRRIDRAHDRGLAHGANYARDEYWRGVEDERARIVFIVAGERRLMRKLVEHVLDPETRR